MTATGNNEAGPGVVFTERLRLEPITPNHAGHLWAIHNDDRVATWYGGWKPSHDEAFVWATRMFDSWRCFGVHKWIAYDRHSGDLIGRGGPSPTPADADWGRVNDLLPAEPWVRQVRRDPRCDHVHANWVEIGWALLPQFWGSGYATEIGRAGLAYAFDTLNMQAVVSCAGRDNRRSRAVMERIGMSYCGMLPALDSGADLTVHTLLGVQHHHRRRRLTNLAMFARIVDCDRVTCEHCGISATTSATLLHPSPERSMTPPDDLVRLQHGGSP